MEQARIKELEIVQQMRVLVVMKFNWLHSRSHKLHLATSS